EVNAEITISADDYARVFRFVVPLRAKEGTTSAKPLTDPVVVLDCPEYAVPGGRLVARTAVDHIGQLPGGAQSLSQVDTEVSVRVQLGRRTAQGRLDAYVSKVLPGHRDQHVYLNPEGPDGAVAFRTSVRDWEVEVPTRGVFGENYVQAQAVNAEGKVVEVKPAGGKPAYALEASRRVLLDGIPPAIVSGGPVDEKLPKGGTLRVVARVKAPPSGIRSVAFAAAKLVPDPKVAGAFLIPEGASRVAAKHDAKADRDGVETWEAVLAEVPTDKKGKVEVAVEAVSNAGLKELGRFEVILVEPAAGAAPGAAAPAGAQTGSIKGKVLEGMRPQAKLPVVLKDVGGAVKADAMTNDAGEYEFKDVPVGPYVVSAVKKKSATKGETPVQVKPGKDPVVADINLTR
ncbi:MAG TPA: carboxypeptidase-like regulatory domain-containing protein, partial [Gemmataceae bacterium]|nr:carboxypeptidase-like regulatory domain-containing protein [Gemmataceae bacterium]